MSAPGRPVLVLLHGQLTDERVWQPVAERQRTRADIRIPNLRTQDDMQHMARDAWAAVTEVPVGTPVALAGFSMGGYVALQMLADAPRPVAALIPGATLAVIDGAGHWAPMEQPDDVAMHLGRWLGRLH